MLSGVFIIKMILMIDDGPIPTILDVVFLLLKSYVCASQLKLGTVVMASQHRIC